MDVQCFTVTLHILIYIMSCVLLWSFLGRTVFIEFDWLMYVYIYIQYTYVRVCNVV